VPEPAAPAEGAGGSEPETWLDAFVREGLDPELAAELGRALGSAGPGAPARERVVPASKQAAERIAELEADLERTHRELLDARREARSSPFSGDFLSLRQAASRREAEIDRLRADVREREHRVEQLTGLIEKLGRRLVPLMRERDLAVERAEELRSRTENAEAETRRAIAQSEEFRKRLEASLGEAQAGLDLEREQHARASEVQELALAELKASYADHLDRTAREHAAALQAARKRHHDELAALARAHEQALGQRDELAQATLRDALAAERAALQAKLEASEREREKELAAQRERHAQQLSALEQARAEGLARAEESAREARDFAVAAEEAAWRERLETQRREHANALALLRKQHQDAIGSLRASMDEAIADRERRLRSAVGDAAAAERTHWQSRLREAEEKHVDALAGLQRQHERELADRRSAHDEILATREREGEAARSRAVAEERSRWEAKLADAQRECEKALAELRSRSDEHLAADRAEHAKLLAAKNRAHAAALRDLAAGEKAGFEAQVEELRRLQAAELELARERARELEARLEEAARDLSARDSTLAALRQELAERADASASLETVIRDLAGTVESLVANGAPGDLIALAIQSTLAEHSRPACKDRPGR
jgi:hypothetical protein